MFCAKCGKSVDENVKFCPGCGTSIEASASTTPIGENNGGKSLLKLGKVAGVVFCLIAGVAIAYFRDAKAYAINSSENLSVIAKLITESISANDELKPIAKVSKCTSVSLDMNAPMDSLEDGKVRKVYKGLANVEMFPRKSSWKSNDNIEYADSVITVRYDIMVVDAGKEIALKSAEMRNSDWQDLVLSTGKSGESDDNDSDESDDDDKDDDATSAKSNEPPLDGAVLVAKRHGMTDLQWKRFVKDNKGRTVVFRNGKVEEVEEDDEDEDVVALRVALTSSFSVSAKVLDSDMAKLAAGLKPRTQIAELRGQIKAIEIDDDPLTEITIRNAGITLAKSDKLSEQVRSSQGDDSQNSVSATAKRLIELMKAQNKMTKEAVGWATKPMSEEEEKAFPVKLAEIGEAACTAMMEKLEGENERLKEFLDLGKIADAERKRQGQKPFLDEDTVKTFLIRLDPDQQKELLEKMKANSKKSEYGSSQKTQITGTDIVRECERKPNGYSSAQIEGLQKKLAGRVLTFEDGKVTDVLECSDDSVYGVHIVVSFKSFTVDAYFPKSDAARLIETVDEGAHIKSLTGRADSEKRWIFFSLTDAKIVLSEK